MSSSTLRKLIVSLSIAYAPAIAWILFEHNLKGISSAHSSIPFRAYGIYPLSLAVSAIIMALVYEGDLHSIAFRISKKKYAAKAFMYANLLIWFPFIMNLINGRVVISGEPQLNTELMTVGLPMVMVFTVSQELMWRGWLLNLLINEVSFLKSAVIIGLLSAAWQVPLFINAGIFYNDVPLWFSIPMFTLSSIGISFIACYLRLTSRSIWPVIFLNVIINYASLSIINSLEETVGESGIYFKYNIGVYYVLTTVGAGIICSMLYTTSNAAKRIHAHKTRVLVKEENALELA